MEMIRCMLHEKKLWTKVTNTTILLLNRPPTKILSKITPFEAWFDYKPNLQNLKIFGYVSYMPQVKRDKLNKKAKPGVFIGYSSNFKAYRNFQPQNGKILVSKDVKFIKD